MLVWPRAVTAPQPQEPRRNFVIRGTVSAVNSGLGLRHAIVTLSTHQGVTVAEARTDGQGRFEFRGIGPGRYELSASAPGYLLTHWGETAANGVRRRLEVQASQTTYDDVSLLLSRGGAIAGRVVDEADEAMEGVPVHALEVIFRAGMERLVPSSMATRISDD